MDRYRARVIGDWLTANRGETTQADFLEDLRRVTGWAPHRPNYSRYENAKSEPEPETLERFVRYWSAKGLPGPDFTPPDPQPDYAALTLAAITRQAEATEQLVGRIDALLASRDRDLEELARTLATLLASPATRPAAGGSRAGRPASSSPDR